MISAVCITHCDLDGYACGAIVKRKYPASECIITNYGKPVPMWKIPPHATVFVTDFSLTYEEFKQLEQRCAEVIWIDHHEANYKKLEAAGLNLKGLRRNDQCGASLTWQFLFPDDPMPECIKLINDFDLWKWELKDTAAFNYGMDLFDARPGQKSATMWASLLNNEKLKLDQIIEHGAPIAAYIEERNNIMAHDLCYTTMIGDKKIMVANNKQANSLFFNSMDKSGLDGIMLVNWFGDFGRYRCSIYSPDDTKEIISIAQGFGGGGHPKAAGFNSPEYPVRTPEITQPDELGDIISKYAGIAKHRSNPVVEQCAAKADSIAWRAQSFMSVWGHSVTHLAMCINHPDLPSLMRTMSCCVDIVHPITGAVCEVVVGYVLTHSGHYRVCVKPLSSKVGTAEKLADMIKLTELNTPGTSVEVSNGYVYYYSTTVPVQPTSQIR